MPSTLRWSSMPSKRLLSHLPAFMLLLAAGMFWTTASGKLFFGFARDSVAEAKRVVWPTRKETMQTTAVVIGFAVVMALFLWAVDATLLTIVNKLMGRSE